MKNGFIIVALILASAVASAQGYLSEEEAIATALKNNYQIQLLRHDSVMNALNTEYAKAAFYPRVNASSNLVFNNNNQKQRLANGTEVKRNGIKSSNFQNSLNLNWTIFDGFKMFITRDKYYEVAKLGELNLQNQVLQTIAETLNGYYNIVRQKQQLQAIQEQMALNEERLKLGEKKLGVGLGAKPEVLQARLDLNAQKVARLTQLSLIEQLKTQLNFIMGVAENTTYEVADSIPFRNDVTAGEALAAAKSMNPQLKLIQQNKRIAEFTLRERKAERWPTVSFNSAYNFNRTNNKMVINTFTPLLNQNHGFNYGLSLSVPIFNNYIVRKNIRAAELDIQYQDLLYKYQQEQIGTAISRAYKNYLLYKSILEIEDENIKSAKENVFIAKERLRLGITTILELREAQKSLEDAYNRLIAARYNTKLAETELLKQSGQLLEK